MTKQVKLYTIRDVARILKLNRQSVGYYIRRGILQAHNIGKGEKRPTWRVKPDELDQFLKSRESI